MRFISFIGLFLVFLVPVIEGKTIYFSGSTGSDAYTIEQAGNQQTPWKTLEKLNSSMALINPGDSILFKRGDQFIGTILWTRSGTHENPIVIGAYGSGLAPVISGAYPIEQWVSTGENIWEADFMEGDYSPNNLMIDGVSQQIGRYPNSDAANSGYLDIESGSGQLSIVSSSLSEAPDMIGGDAIIRTKLWLIDRSEITNQTTNSIQLASSLNGPIKPGFGFFFQNHINTLDQAGEWCYNDTNKKICLYYPSDPNSFSTDVAFFDVCFHAENIQFITIEDLEFYGSSFQSVFFESADHIIFRRNTISNAGNDAVIIRSSDYIQVESNSILNSNNNALVVLNCDHVEIVENTLRNTGLRPGMGAQAFQDPLVGLQLEYTGIFLRGTDILCEGNYLGRTGYNGIYFTGDSILVARNHIDYFCMIMEDGGGIYTYNEELITHTDRRIEENIILNAVGAPEGSDNPEGFSDANGIYLDYGSDHVQVIGNTVAHCVHNGIFNSHANSNSFIANTLYNNTIQYSLSVDVRDRIIPVTNCDVSENIFFSRTSDQYLAKIKALKKEGIHDFGSFDYNYYCRPTNDFDAIRLIYMEDNSSTYVQELLDLKSWQKEWGKDEHSHGSQYQLPIFSSEELEPNRLTNGDFEAGLATWGCWSPNENCLLTWEDSDKFDGGYMKAEFTPPSGESYGRMFIRNYVGELEAGENYVMNFSLLASQDDRVFQLLLREGVAPYDFIHPIINLNASSSEEEYKILFVPELGDENARIDFLLYEDGADYWFDDIEFYKADIELTSSEDSIVFIYNPTSSPMEYYDGNYYVDARGIRYHNFELQPYQSLILLKISELIYSMNDVDAPPGGLQVYPNPANDLINIGCDIDMDKQLGIYDFSGRCVHYQAFNGNSMTIDVSFLHKGVYIIRVQNDNDVMSAKFIKL